MNDQTRDWLCRRAIQAAPYEACGFILYDGEIVEIPNSAVDPTCTFFMAKHHLAQRVSNPNDIQAIWHTHPNGTTYPSETDQKMMTELGKVYGKWDYYIVTADTVTKYVTVQDFSEFVGSSQ